ncbi:MAG: cytochrome c oxidase assembly protein [Carbonactinosporaceae bacterium]
MSAIESAVAGTVGRAGRAGTVVLAHDTPGGVPPDLTVTRLFTAWTFDLWLAVVILSAAGLYLAGVRALRRRGDTWPWSRTVLFLVPGLGSVVLATQSSLATYDTTLLSVHMVQHMVLSMAAPVFLALGAPITLALRTLPRGPRRRLLAVVHSRAARVLSFPLLAGAVFVVTPFALYFSEWYTATLRNDYLHEAMHLHFLLFGCLWFWPLLGLDPVPNRLAYPIRMLAIFATLPFHAWLGIAIMSASDLIGEQWYASLGRDWGPGLFDDQQTAGGILWVTGDLVGLVLLAVLFVQWVRASEREAEREDRRLDRLEAEAARTARRPGP